MNVDELRSKLIEKQKLTFNDVNLDDLEEITQIKISRKPTSNEKIIDFIKSSSNPYMFKCNGKKIKIEFLNTKQKAEESLTNVLKEIYK